MKAAAVFFSLCLLCPCLSRAELEYRVVVKEGDTSLSLSERFLTIPADWNKVVEHNRLLRPGNMITVPASLLDVNEKAFLSLVYGQVSLRLAGGEAWIQAIPGLVLQKGDTLKTSLNSGAEIVMATGDKAMIRELTEVTYEPYVNPQHGRTNLLKVIQGKVISLIAKIKNRDTRYEIQTPTAVSLVRGTKFRTKVTYDGASIFEVLEGQVKLKSGGRAVNLRKDSGIRIQNL